MKFICNFIIRASLALAVCLLASIPAWGTPANHFIHISEKMNLSRNDIKFVVEGLGGQLRHCLSRTEFIVWLPEKSSNARFIFKQLGGAYIEDFQRRISFDTTFLNGTFIPDKPNTQAARIWNRYKSKVISGGGSVSDSSGDVTTDFEVLAPALAESGITEVAVVNKILLPISSLYMIGEIALSIVMMESTGSLHNWTTQDEDDAIAETILETDWISSEALDNGIQVTWVYEIHRGVPTSFEPIEHFAPTDGFTWIDDALAYFNSGSDWDGTFSLGQTVASNNSANWGIILFLVMNQPGGKVFPNGGRAYAPVKGSGGTVQQGTFAVATFTGIHNDVVGQHEISHLFGAVDEEGAAPTCETSIFACLRVYGYLNFPNINCQLCNQVYLCPMLLSDRKFCPWSQGHIGWKDTDGDGAPDPIDPNSGRWMSILPVVPGDRVTITQPDQTFITTFFVTENNSDDGLGAGLVVWDGQNFDNVTVAPGFYSTVTNNDPPVERSLHIGDPTVKPTFSDAGFWFDDSLRFKLETSFANVTIVLKDSTGLVVGRPLWDKFFGSSPTLVHAVDLSYLPDKTYTAEFTAWRSDGGLSNPFSISFIQYVCGDATNEGLVNIADVSALIGLIFNQIPIDNPIERGDADGNGSVTVADITYLIERIFNAGPAPICSGVQQ